MKALPITAPRAFPSSAHLREDRRGRAGRVAPGPTERAQIPTGNILGTVKDSQGGAIPGASVTATNEGTQYSRTATTDGTGVYTLRLLPVGNYTLVVSMTGFKTFSQKSILLEVGRNARIDPVIELGALAEVVSVVGEVPLIETTSAALSRSVGEKEVMNLPLVNRDLYSLLSITGGVSSNSTGQLPGRPGAEHHDQRFRQRPDGHGQLPARRRQQHRGPARHRQPFAQSRSGAGVPGPHQRLRGGVRPLSAGVVDVVTKSGTNQIPRGGLRVLPQREPELEALGAPGSHRDQGSRWIATSSAARSAAR